MHLNYEFVSISVFVMIDMAVCRIVWLVVYIFAIALVDFVGVVKI